MSDINPPGPLATAQPTTSRPPDLPPPNLPPPNLPPNLSPTTSAAILKFYQSPQWKVKRLEIIERDHGECQRCKRQGSYRNRAGSSRYTKADCVHHLKHVVDRYDLRLDSDNLVSLCNACHNDVHPEKLLSTSKGWSERWD